ncbi:MAG: response regulator [Nitrosotalea sp.]
MEIFSQPREKRDRPGITAIVIDDDIDTVSVLSEFLQIKGISVIGKGYDGLNAIKMYKKLLPDVVFLDVMMENHDGFYTLEKIREIEPNAIVMLITADLTEETRKRLLGLDASAIIYKPYDINEVISETNNLVLRLKHELLEEIAAKKARLQEMNAILENRLIKSKINALRSKYFNEKEKLI